MIQNQQYIFEIYESYSKDARSKKIEIRRSMLDADDFDKKII